jgi:hypothetical protein
MKKTKPGRQAEGKCPERQCEQFTSNTFKTSAMLLVATFLPARSQLRQDYGLTPFLTPFRGLPARRHPQKATASGFEPLHHSTDFKPDAVRENAHSTSAFSTPASIRVAHHTKSSGFTGFLNRTVVT